MKPGNPWSWVTEARLTYALKLLLVIGLTLYLGGLILNFLDRIRGVVFVLVAAVFLAYLIYPVVEWLRRRMPLVAAVLLVYAVILGLLVLAAAIFIPRLTDDIAMFAHHYPEIIAAIDRFVTDPNNRWLAHLPEPVRAGLAKIPFEFVDWLKSYGLGAAGHALGILVGAFTTVAAFVIVPLITLYIFLDFTRFRAGFLRVVPQSRLHETQAFLGDIDRVIGGYVRGQLFVALTVGVLLTIALLIMHVRYAFLLGAVAAVGDLIPYVGAVIAFIPSVLTAWLDHGWVSAAIVAGIIIGIFELEGHVISPTIISSQVKLSPLIVLIAVLIGAELAGIPGMLVAVPVAGVLRVCVLRLTAQAKAPAPVSSNQEAP